MSVAVGDRHIAKESEVSTMAGSTATALCLAQGTRRIPADETDIGSHLGFRQPGGRQAPAIIAPATCRAFSAEASTTLIGLSPGCATTGTATRRSRPFESSHYPSPSASIFSAVDSLAGQLFQHRFKKNHAKTIICCVAQFFYL
jgi:hypothetical protein